MSGPDFVPTDNGWTDIIMISWTIAGGVVHIWRGGSYLEGWFISGGVVHIWRGGSYLEGWFISGGLVHIWRVGPRCELNAHKHVSCVIEVKTNSMMDSNREIVRFMRSIAQNIG